MNAIAAFLNATPWLRFAVDIASVVIPLSALLALAGTGLLSATAKILFIRRKRAAFDKCARQLATLGLALGWLLLIGGRVWLSLAGQPENSLQTFVTEICWILLCAGVLLISLYYALWKHLSGFPVVHAAIGILSGLQGCAALVAALAAARYLAALAEPDAGIPVPQNLFLPDWSAPFWNALCYTPLLVLAMPGAFGALWLAFRRKYEDFGRDYYNTMIPWCAAWARNAWGLLWLMLLVSSAAQIYRQPGGFNAQDAVFQTTQLLLWLLPALIWTIVCRSATALRHKFALFAALFVAMAFMLPYYLEVTNLHPENFLHGMQNTQ
ncbi:MAG: hypothetical protein LBB60_06450 [Desulfovibrio sp.]|jgi:hypothetical protein|nr:hypothetical protein [Desulfovibrio sp.]